MKLISYFDEFLKNVVNLNQARIDKLEQRVGAISDFLKSRELLDGKITKISPQGSWRHKTIIKPSEKNNEFDADILLYLEEFEDWEPKDYVEKLYSEFRSNDLYKDKVSRKTRCVTLEYKDEFHLDIVPAFTRESMFFGDQDFITNRLENTEEQTNPDGFADWFKRKNGHTSSNNLIKVVRLAKYMRDIKGNYSVKSVLLTTLLAGQVNDDSYNGDDPDTYFPDLPTSIKTIFERLDEYLQKNESMPEIENPSLKGEKLTRHWDKDIYRNFREKINLYSERIKDAYLEEDSKESAKKWQKVFGEKFASDLSKEASAAAIVIREDTQVSHCRSPLWRIEVRGKVTIDAYVYSGDKNKRFGGINSDGRGLSKNLWIKFIANTNIQWPYETFWQVVNTGQEAAEKSQLRGGFDTGQNIHWESTEYKGRHWIECFIVKEGLCVARSGKFYVNIN